MVFGTRPEIIKLAPVIRLLGDRPEKFETLVCSTGQHNELMHQTIEILGIDVDIVLDAMESSASLCSLAAFVISKFDGIFEAYAPDVVLVHGDTSTAMAVAIAAFYRGIKVGHVEAGLRSHNLNAPFPEEFNRKAIAQATYFHFAPTEISKNNLLKEGFSQDLIFVTGNTVIDSLHWMVEKLVADEGLSKSLSSLLTNICGFNLAERNFVLITGHRRENFGEPFQQIFGAIRDLAESNPNLSFVYPVHLNPQVKDLSRIYLGEIQNVFLCRPLDYEEFIFMLMHCEFVITDSGGIQEEAPALGKQVLVTREQTERPEVLETGYVKLVGSSRERILNAANELISAEHFELAKKWQFEDSPVGKGNAAQSMITVLEMFAEDRT